MEAGQARSAAGGRKPYSRAKGFAPDHPLIEDIKRKDFVALFELTEQQVCDARFMAHFVAACRKMSPIVEFTTMALGLKY